MATFEQRILDQLTSRAMPEKAARQVLEILKTSEANVSMEGRWNDDTSEYPLTILAILWGNAKSAALDWIDANVPMAFYRPMFDDGDPLWDEETSEDLEAVNND